MNPEPAITVGYYMERRLPFGIHRTTWVVVGMGAAAILLQQCIIGSYYWTPGRLSINLLYGMPIPVVLGIATEWRMRSVGSLLRGTRYEGVVLLIALGLIVLANTIPRGPIQPCDMSVHWYDYGFPSAWLVEVHTVGEPIEFHWGLDRDSWENACAALVILVALIGGWELFARFTGVGRPRSGS